MTRRSGLLADMKKLKNLCHDSNLVTGLVLNFLYYDEEMGERYDDVDHTKVCSCWKA